MEDCFCTHQEWVQSQPLMVLGWYNVFILLCVSNKNASNVDSKCWNMIFIQIGHSPGAITANVLNVLCKDLPNPINGQCIGGWLYADDGDVFSDPTVTTTCKGNAR